MYRLSEEEITVLHERVLEIGIIFHNILDRHSIPYYMLGGTMLGAIRHKGFIPWDDDMDFGIPRAYYDEALSALEKELPNRYRLLRSTSGQTLYDCSKIEDTATEIEEEGGIEKGRGVFVDIFPLDYGNGKWGILSKNRWIRIFMFLNTLKKHWPPKIELQFCALFVRLFPRNFFLSLSRRMLSSEGNYMINYGGFWGAKEIVVKEIFGIPRLYIFDRFMFYGVENPDKYLQKLYGNYMELPPEEKRHSHIINFKIKNN